MELVSPENRAFFGHPRGLAFIAGTELWDRISFHGMQALLVLYMVDQLLLPGHVEHVVGFAAFRAAIQSVTGPLSAQALAFQIFGLYIGLVYFTPVFGGALGDRVLGRVRTVTLGALLMTAGHFCLAFDRSFLLALLLLILGAGCLRGNLQPQVGELYAKDDRRRTTAFQIYAAMIAFGGFVAPIVTGQLAKSFTWHVGFAFAGFGMLVGLGVYLYGRPYLPPDPPRHERLAAPPLTREERTIVWFLILLLPVACAVLDCAEPGVEHLQHLGARSREPHLRQLDDAGAVAAIAGWSGAVRLHAAGADVLELAAQAWP